MVSLREGTVPIADTLYATPLDDWRYSMPRRTWRGSI